MNEYSQHELESNIEGERLSQEQIGKLIHIINQEKCDTSKKVELERLMMILELHAAAEKNAELFKALADTYEQENSILFSKAKANFFLHKAAQLDNPDACYYWGKLLLQNYNLKEKSDGVAWIIHADQLGNVKARKWRVNLKKPNINQPLSLASLLLLVVLVVNPMPRLLVYQFSEKLSSMLYWLHHLFT
jgi:hypothetical protein